MNTVRAKLKVLRASGNARGAGLIERSIQRHHYHKIAPCA
jgi:hypothetical protein